VLALDPGFSATFCVETADPRRVVEDRSAPDGEVERFRVLCQGDAFPIFEGMP